MFESYLRNPVTEHRAKFVEQTYGPILNTLSLAPSALIKVKLLLLERLLAAEDANELTTKRGLNTHGELTAAISLSQNPIEQEIQSLVSAADFATIKNMLDVQLRLGDVESGYAPIFASQGQALTGLQMLSLATIFTEVYAKGISHDWDAPIVTRLRAQIPSIDPATGLSALDREVIERTASLLSPTQLELLKVQLVSETKKKADYATAREKGN